PVLLVPALGILGEERREPFRGGLTAAPLPPTSSPGAPLASCHIGKLFIDRIRKPPFPGSSSPEWSQAAC
ncbi:MAG: hypothetical protein ACU83V_14470, partial [Gammaproteobacteria bacterium]